MATHYDQIWQQFLDINKTSSINLPNTDEKKYSAINSAVRHYNNRLNDTIACDDETETVSEDLTDNKLILVAHYLKLTFLENQWLDFASTWNPFSKDIGLKNIQSQLSALKELVNIEKQEIEKIILNSSEDYI